MFVPRGDVKEDIRFSVAGDVGGIELLHANYRGFELGSHTHEGYSISVSLHGGLVFDQRGSKHTAPSGVISAVEPGAMHNARGVEENWEFLNFLVPLGVARSAVAEISDSEKLPGFAQRVILDHEMARRLVLLHTRLQASQDPLARRSATVLTLTEFFRRHSTVRTSSMNGATPRHTVQRARELLQDSYGDRITLDELAICAGLSPFHFLRVFVQELGVTPHAYLNQIRVREAKRMLSAGAPCAQVALECGFCDQSHMTRAFKRVSGITPGQYQSAYRRACV